MRIIHFLNCNIKSIINYLEYIKNQNFDTIQINSVQPFIKDEENYWWATYQPLDFTIGNKFGNKEDLINLCKEAKELGINVVVDVITNHLANDGNGRETIPNESINPALRNNNKIFKKHTKVNQFTSYEDIIKGSIGLPGLDLTNKEIQDIILNFLDELKNCGVKGFRFDAAKHIGLPSDGVDYFKRVKQFLNENDLFAYGEFLDGPNITNELTETIYNKKNELAGLMYILTEDDSLVDDPSKKVTFVESHDSYLNDFGTTKDEKSEDIIKKYAELTKKYHNTVYYVRDLTKGQPTKESNRILFADNSWITSDIIKKANLNIGNELKNNETIQKEKLDNERLLMYKHHKMAMLVHEILINQLDKNSTINDCIDKILLDYNIQCICNTMLGIVPYDDELIKLVIGEFYGEIEDKIHITYNELCIRVLTVLKERAANYKVTDGIDEQIAILKRAC